MTLVQLRIKKVCQWREPGTSGVSEDSSDVSSELTANATVHTTGSNVSEEEVA